MPSPPGKGAQTVRKAMSLGRAPLHRLIILIAGAILALCAAAHSAEAADDGTVTSYYARIHYPSRAVLNEFADRTSFGSTRLGTGAADIGTVVADNVDRIVFRVKTLLDMYPTDLAFSIHIFETYAELSGVYRSIGMIGTPPVAFYSHGVEGIYLTVERLNAGILAHEISHAIINTYFENPPPAKMQEILSQYVDMHLNDSTAPPRR